MRDHRKLLAFELVHNLCLCVYRNTDKFPKAEVYGLTSQIRRASVSVSANIVEGCARNSQADYLRFLDIAFGSLRETGYFLQLSADLGYLQSEAFEKLDEQYTECARVLSGLISSLRGKA